MRRFIPLTSLLVCIATANAESESEKESIATKGLVLHYDFSGASRPAQDGRITDLSPSRSNGFIRPVRARPAEGLSSARTGWLPHRIVQGDGRGGWLTRPAKVQALRHPKSTMTMPFGMVVMDNGEIVLQCSAEGRTRPVIAFSKDGGETWSDFQYVPGSGRPMLLTYHGGGTLSYLCGQRYFSRDYGRTWSEPVPHPPTHDGHSFHVEGNAWVDRDENGLATAILELGWHYKPGKKHPRDDANVVFRRSRDGGRTWGDEVSPPQWKFSMKHAGQAWLRGVSEGGIVRAANGDLVAALRSDMPPSFFDVPHDDSLEGTAISISKDDGKTWSPMNILFYAGRHHANLQRLPSGDLVCTLVVRDDVDGLEFASDRRGCDALISRDHGRTWNLDRRYELHSYRFERDDGYWVDGMCGHIAAVTLADGHIISAYGNYLRGAAVLVKWRPDAEPTEPLDKSQQKLEQLAGHSALRQVANPDADFQLVPNSLTMNGRAWIHLPLTKQLAALDRNGTIEFVIKPDDQGGMPALVGCGTLGVSGFRLGYDQRNIANSRQVIFSDQRVRSERMEYSIQVASQSQPKPFSTDVQQIAYVVRDGHGTFLRDGVPFSHQTETGTDASLFQYTVKKSPSVRKRFASIGAYVHGVRPDSAFEGQIFAVRIYDRALSADELKANLAATPR